VGDGASGADGWQRIPCNGQELDIIDEHTFTRSIDFVATYYSAERVLYGEACRNADDAATCRATVDGIKPSAQGSPSFVMTDDDEVLLVDEPEALAALLGGSIDSEHEAVLASLLDGQYFDCRSEMVALGWGVRPLGSGYELQRGGAGCHEWLLVDANGNISSRRTDYSGCPSRP
jgi:hypothetical protein